MELKPIAAVRIGCVVEDGGAMHGTVLDRSAKITALNPLEQIECSISGESDLVYTSQTNQASARLSCFLKFDVNESSFSSSKVEFQAASFDLPVYTVESLTKRGAKLRSGVENIGELGAK